MKRFAAVMLCALALAWAGSAVAHDERDYRNGRYGDARQIGTQNGYRDGFEHGRMDRARNVGYDPRESRGRDDRGYDRSMGNQGQYKQAYRDGYRQGYDAGYYGRNGGGVLTDRRGGDIWRDRGAARGRYPGEIYGRGGVGGYRDVAWQNGYNEGVAAGRDDANDGDRYDPHRHNQYKNADRGYNSSYGNKDGYKAAFREAYLRGYEEGYRGVRGGFGGFGGRRR